MRPEDIFEAFSDIDEELVAGAKHIEGGDSQVIVIEPTPLWKKITGWCAAAACLAVLVVGGILGIKYFSGKNAVTPPVPDKSDDTSISQSGCSANASPEYPEEAKYVYTGDYSELEPFKPLGCGLSYETYYDSLVSLEEESDLIVIGEFTDDSHQLFDPKEPNTGNSYNKFRVDKVVKGRCSEGEEIIICQDGVVGGGKFYYTDNYTPMVKGDKWIYFLMKFENVGYYVSVHHTGRYPVPGEEHEFVLNDNAYGVFDMNEFRSGIYEDIKERLPDWKYAEYFESEYPDGTERFSGDYQHLKVEQPTIHWMSMDMLPYDDVFNRSKFIVAGEFIDDAYQQIFDDEDGIRGSSYNKFRVDKVYGGDIEEGQVIIIRQDSFVYNGTFYDIDNMTPMIKGDKWLYCLTKTDGICYPYMNSNGRYPIPGSGNAKLDFADGYYGVYNDEYANREVYERLLNELDIAVTKDFDGVVLSVMADSGSLNVTATVRNTTDKPIGLYMPCEGEGSHTEISTTISRGRTTLTDISVTGGVDTALDSHIVQPGEEYVQKMSFAVPLNDSIPSPGYEVGEYKGVASIGLLADPNNPGGDVTQRLVEFGMTIREQNTVSRDFDGVVLTVSTNGKTFRAGEDFKVTATVRNDTVKPIGLWMPVTGEGSHTEITTRISRGVRSLLDVSAASVGCDAESSLIIQPGGVYVQEMTFSTFTGWYSDYPAMYEYGEYNGTATIKLLSDPNDTSSGITERLVEFTIEIADENSEVKPDEVEEEIEQIYSGSMNMGTVDWKMEEFPGVTFRCDGMNVSALTEGVKDENGKELYAVQNLYDGMPVMDVYLVDLNLDGKREIISMVAYGSGIVDEHIEAYDFANNVHYTLEDRMYYDYSLKFEDGKLLVVKRRYNESEVMNEQTLTFNMLWGQPVETPVSIIAALSDESPVSWIMEEFPNVTFSADTSGISADNGAKKQLYADVTVENVLLCDLNGDGRREIISQIKKSGCDTEGIRMYDYANSICYEYWASYMNYTLSRHNNSELRAVVWSADGESNSEFELGKLYGDELINPVKKYSGFENVSKEYSEFIFVHEFLNVDADERVCSSVNGEVVDIGEPTDSLTKDWGNYICILGDDGLYYYYGGPDGRMFGDIKVNVGDRVEIGQALARIGYAFGVRFARADHKIT